MQSAIYKMNRVMLLTTILLLLIVGSINVCKASDANITQAQSPQEAALDGIYFKEMFHLSKEELISRLGEPHVEGTTAIEKSHIILPCLFYHDLGVTFILGGGAVRYIKIVSETNIKDININDAKPGMNFEEIRYKLGEAEVNETWEASKTIKIYEMHYVITGLKS